MARKKLDKISSHFRIKPKTSDELNQMAVTLGYLYGSGGAVGEMLDALADGELILIPKKYWEKISRKMAE